MYIEKFVLPDEEQEYSLAYKRRVENGGSGDTGYLENPYPCQMFLDMELSQLDFANITILYGGNGSGKSTLLNLLAQKLKLDRLAPFNGGELFEPFAHACKIQYAYDDYGTKQKLPSLSRIITSDDIFDYMMAARTLNNELNQDIEDAKQQYIALKRAQSIRFEGLENYEDFKLQVYSRKKSLSRRKFIWKFVGREAKLNSNGETAIDYFADKIKNDTFYCLDEPENSLSPLMQLSLKDFLEQKARYCGCQFVIATHSPFLLALDKAKIYNLDATPVNVCNWWELENAQTYYKFFAKNAHLFKKD